MDEDFRLVPVPTAFDAPPDVTEVRSFLLAVIRNGIHYNSITPVA